MVRALAGMGANQYYPVFVLMLGVCLGCNLGEAPHAEAQLKSSNQMKELILSIRNYREVNGQWPDSISDVKPLLTDTHLDMLMSNPVTGDIPGYEYVKPTYEADLETTVILYQLRNRQRATDLPAGYADNRVAEIGSSGSQN